SSESGDAVRASNANFRIALPSKSSVSFSSFTNSFVVRFLCLACVGVALSTGLEVIVKPVTAFIKLTSLSCENASSNVVAAMLWLKKETAWIALDSVTDLSLNGCSAEYDSQSDLS